MNYRAACGLALKPQAACDKSFRANHHGIAANHLPRLQIRVTACQARARRQEGQVPQVRQTVHHARIRGRRREAAQEGSQQTKSKSRGQESQQPASRRQAFRDDDDDEDGGIYGYFSEEQKAEEDKPQIEYAPDMSIKDLRGPAQAAVVPPSNYLLLIGGLCCLSDLFHHLFLVLADGLQRFRRQLASGS